GPALGGGQGARNGHWRPRYSSPGDSSDSELFGASRRMRPGLRARSVPALPAERGDEFKQWIWRQEFLFDSRPVSAPMNLFQLVPLVGAICNALVTLFVSTRGLRSTLNKVYLVWGISLTIWNFGTYQMFVVRNSEDAIFW